MRWHYLALLACLSCGCATKQDYRMLPKAYGDAMVQENAVVIEGTVSKASTSSGSFGQSAHSFLFPISSREMSTTN